MDQSLITIIVTIDHSIINVAFEPDLPKMVKFHLKCVIFEKFVNKIINKQTLEIVRITIAVELKNLIATDRLYYFNGQWRENCTLFNYNSLNF